MLDNDDTINNIFKIKEDEFMGIYEELIARGLLAQVTNEEEIRNLVNNGHKEEARWQ